MNEFSKPAEQKTKPKRRLMRGAAATVAAALAFTGLGVKHAIDSASNEQPEDRGEVEAKLAGSELAIQGVVSGMQGRESRGITKDVPKLITQAGDGIRLEKNPLQQNTPNQEVTAKPNSSFLYIPGGIEYTGSMQDMDQLTGISQTSEDGVVNIDWSKVDIHQPGAERPTGRFEGVKIVTDQHGNKVVAGVPSRSAPDQGLTILNIASGIAEDGGRVTVGVDSDNPVSIEIPEATEGYRVRSIPFASQDQWGVQADDTVSSAEQFADALYERGIPISGVVDVNRGDVSSALDTEGVPIVSRYLVIAGPDGGHSEQALQISS